MRYEIFSSEELETYSAGQKIAHDLTGSGHNKFYIALYGDVGCGKTVIAKGLVSVFAPKSRVKSPSYTIVNEYLSGETPVYHFDFYRISSEDELIDIGFEDYIENGICISEWTEKLETLLPDDAVKIRISKTEDTNRRKIEVDIPDKFVRKGDR